MIYPVYSVTPLLIVTQRVLNVAWWPKWRLRNRPGPGRKTIYGCLATRPIPMMSYLRNKDFFQTVSPVWYHEMYKLWSEITRCALCSTCIIFCYIFLVNYFRPSKHVYYQRPGSPMTDYRNKCIIKTSWEDFLAHDLEEDLNVLADLFKEVLSFLWYLLIILFCFVLSNRRSMNIFS